MRGKIHRHILRKAIVVFVFIGVFLAPLSVSINDRVSNTEYSGNISMLTVGPATAQAGDIFPSPQDIASGIGSWLGNALLSTASMLTWAGGQLLEISIDKLVVGFGSWINDTDFGTMIDDIWVVVRDICNLLFIFGFIFLGVKLILSGNDATTKRMLAQLIIAALLINFSLFITKAIIEFSNLIAYNIYSAMREGGGTITATIVQILDIQTFYQPVDPGTTAKLTSGGSIGFYIMGAIFLIITAFAFFNGAIMLISRFVGLVFIMMFSPLLFAARIFPQTEQYAKAIWGKLLSYSFYAPAYIFLIFIAILVLQKLPLGNPKGFSKVFSNPQSSGGDFYSVVLNFVVAIIVIQTATSLAGKMGLAGSAIAIKIADKGKSYLRRGVGAGTAGLAAASLRASMGRRAQGAVEKEGPTSLRQRAATSWTAKQQLKVSQALADNSFDLRNVAGVGKSLDVGTGRKGGYKTVQEEVKKKEEDFAASLGTLDDTDVRVKGRKKEQEQLEKELRKLRAKKDAAVTTTDKADAAEEIYKKEQEISRAKRKYEQEKQRLQIGTTYEEYNNEGDERTLGRIDERIVAHKTNVKNGWEKFAEMAEEDKRSELAHMQKLENTLMSVEKERSNFLNQQPNQGYASVRETDKWWNTWITGRLVTQNKEAGKAIRKAREKGLPKEKEDK